MDEFEDGVVGAKSKNLAGSHKAGVNCCVVAVGDIPQEVLPSSNSNNMQGRLYRSHLHASIAWMSRMSRGHVDGGGEGAGPAL